MIRARQRAYTPMATAMGVLAISGLSTWAGPARAQAAATSERVFVLDLVDNGVGKDAARRVTEVLRNELAAVTGDRMVKPSAVAAIIARPEVAEQVRCQRETYVDCAVAVGQKIPVNFVVAGVVAALGDAQLVDLRLIDVRAHTETNRLQTPLTGDAEKDRAALRELGVRLVAPDSWTGTLEINGLVNGDKVIVDGSPMATRPPKARLDVAVGSHAVLVSRDNKALLTQVVEIKYGQTAALALAGGGQAGGGQAGGSTAGGGSQQSAGPSRFARWPIWVAAGSGLALAAVSVGFVADDLINVRSQMAKAQRAGDDRKASDNPCAIRERTTFYCELEALKTYETVDLSVAAACGVAAAGALGAAIYFFAAPGDEATESKPATAGKPDSP